MIQGMLAVWSVVPLPFTNPACTSGSSVYVLLKPSLKDFEQHIASMCNECKCTVVGTFCGIAFLWDWNGIWPFPVLFAFAEFSNFSGILSVAMVHVIRLASFLWLWFQCFCPLMPSCNTYLLLGFLLLWKWGIWSHGPQPCLTQWNYEPCHIPPPKADRSWWRGLTKCGPLEKGMANHFSILALRTPWTAWKGKR